MAASKNTVIGLYMVLQKHLSPNKATALLADLERVKGNKSLTQTIARLAKLHRNVCQLEADHQEYALLQLPSKGAMWNVPK